MKQKLTDTGIKALKPRAAAYAIGDQACIGLRLRITPNGVKSFAFAYRDKTTGKVMWLTVGRYPDIPLAKARELVGEFRKTLAAGGTPLAPKTERAEAEKKTKTYADVVEDYFDGRLKEMRTGHATRTTLQRIGRVYAWNERPITSITEDDAIAMLKHIAVVRGKKRTANQTKHLLQAMFKWASSLTAAAVCDRRSIR